MEDKKEKEVKEAKVEEEKVEVQTEPKKKNKKGKGIYIVLCLFILLVFCAFVVALNNIGLLNIGPLEEVTNKKKVTLKYTDTAKEKKEGIYITDVSDVVEEVMPSIVAITSNTLVNQGYYGPSFFD